MKTIILPGFSKKNKEWTDNLKKNLKLSQTVIAIDWDHWNLGGGLKLKKEIEKIDNLVGKEDFNIIAKSVGTMVSLLIIKKYKEQINKVILCGIPSISQKRIDMFKDSIKDFNLKNMVCFQNSFDPFVSYKKLKREINKIDNNILIIKKNAKNHDYYYSEDFQEFLI